MNKLRSMRPVHLLGIGMALVILGGVVANASETLGGVVILAAIVLLGYALWRAVGELRQARRNKVRPTPTRAAASQKPAPPATTRSAPARSAPAQTSAAAPTLVNCAFCRKPFPPETLDTDGHCPACAQRHAEWKAKMIREQEKQREISEREWAQIEAIPTYEITISPKPRKRNKGFEPVKFSNITPKGKYPDIVVLDTETTGVTPYQDRIVELAAIRFVDRVPVEKFRTYVNPGRPIPAEASRVNKITDDMVADAPTIGQVIESFDAFLGDSILVAHNLEFDLKLVYYSGSRLLETSPGRKYIDTLAQARKILKKPRDVDNHKLGTLCDYYRIPMARWHSAIADAYATGQLFSALMDDIQH